MARSVRPYRAPHSFKVVALQGHPVSAAVPDVGDTLVWDGTEWVPTPMPSRVRSNDPTAFGETLNLDTTVVALQGTPVFPIGPVVQPGDALLWTGVDWKNYPVAKSLSASDLGPYLPISAYNPGGGGGGDFLPLTGGVLSGPGALTVGDILTVEGAASAGGNSLVDMRGGSAVVQADGNGLLLQQLGDQYGLTSLLIANRDGLNGAMFTNEGLDLVDFAFQTSSAVTGTLRLDARAIPTGQFLFMLSGNTLFTVDSAGNAQFFGTTTLAGDAVAPLEAVTLEQLNNAIANLPPPAPPLNGPIIGVTDGSNAAAGMVGEVISTSTGPVTITSTTWTDVVTLNVTPGDWDVIGYVDNITAGFDAQATPPVDGGIGFALRVNNTWSPGPGYLGGRAAMVNQPGSGTFNNISTSIFAGPLRVNTAVTVTVTLTVSITLLRSVVGGSGSSNGNMIWARRMR